MNDSAAGDKVGIDEDEDEDEDSAEVGRGQ
jgi:hypothetical protein